MIVDMFNTEIKQRQRALAQEADELQNEISRFERIFKGSRGYGFVDWDLANRVMHWNGGFWQYLGYSEDDMLEISNQDRFLKFIHPEDQHVLDNNIYRLLKGEKLVEIILRVQKKHSGFIWASIRVDVSRRDDDWVDYISGIIFDISKLKLTEQARKLSEARHERIIQSSKDGIWEWNANKDSFHFSRRCWELLGYKEDDDVVTAGKDRWKSWRELMHPDDVQNFKEVLKSHLKFGTPFDVEYRAQARDASWRWIRARGQAELDENGRSVRMSGTNMDVTQLKEAEERVLQAKEQAENANRAKSEFLSSMSHELRTPLNAILGFARVLASDESLTREQRASMREVLRAGNHLLQLVNDVLDLARIEAGKMEVDMQILDPLELMYECIELVKPEAANKHLSIDCQNRCQDTAFIEADRIRLKQIFLNLLSNAIKYNKYDGYVRIAFEDEIENENKSANKGELKISITDSGKGIDEDARADIFKPFNRLGEEGSNIEGAGIGLVITKTLVEQMHGSLDFSSQSGRGTTFWIVFSKTDEPRFRDKRTPKDEPAEDRGTGLALKKQLNVLYIDDNPTNQRVLQQTLEPLTQIHLSCSGDPLEGIYKARTEKPDLILLDYDLPELNGVEVLRVLKQSENFQHIPVVALSAKAMAHDIKTGLASGFDDYLTKPFELEKFIACCNTLLA